MLEMYKGRYIVPGQKVFVYFNLHKNCLSLKALNGPFKGKVIAHANGGAIELANCQFVVAENGRQKVLKTRQKNVHAAICGELLVGYDLDVAEVTNVPVTYNPYKYEQFVNAKTFESIFTADLVRMEGKAIFAYNVNELFVCTEVA